MKDVLVFTTKDLARQSHNQMGKSFHHEGHEEHEVRRIGYPNPWCPS